MKRVIAMSVVLMAVLGLSAVPASAQKKTRIAVFNFEDKTDHAWHWWTGQPVGHGMADMLITALVKTGKYRVFERAEMEKLLQEQGLGMSGITTPESAAKAAKVMGVEVAVIGAVTEFGYKKQSTGGALKKIGIGASVSKQSATVGIDVRLVSVSSSEILTAENIRKEKSKMGGSFENNDISLGSQSEFDETLVGKATREAVDEIVKILGNASGAASGYKIVSASGGKVIINGGKEDGINVGDRFTIFRAGEELIDPDSGESLGSEESQVGVIEVTDNNYAGKGKASACKIVSGSDLQKGDMVRAK
jgi:curli biogenesis system outer membrane secretion channel CsgG